MAGPWCGSRPCLCKARTAGRFIGRWRDLRTSHIHFVDAARQRHVVFIKRNGRRRRCGCTAWRTGACSAFFRRIVLCRFNGRLGVSLCFRIQQSSNSVFILFFVCHNNFCRGGVSPPDCVPSIKQSETLRGLALRIIILSVYLRSAQPMCHDDTLHCFGSSLRGQLSQSRRRYVARLWFQRYPIPHRSYHR